MVLVPILRVKIEPYLSLTSLTYSKKGFPERATWKRLPTIGHPGGPGGRFNLLDLVLRVRKKTRPDMKRAKAVKEERVSIFGRESCWRR